MTTTTTATIGTLTTAFQHIALSKLVPSAANVRKVNSTAGIGELADSIEAHGLIQNLTVRKAGKGQKFEVVAGARRLAALRLLEPVPKGLSDWGTRDSKGLFRPSWSERCGPQPLAGSIVARDFDMKRI